MARPKNLGEHSSEVVERNFLEENPEIPTQEKIVVAQEVPKYKKVRFMNNRDPGVTLHFHYHSATHPLKHYDLVHGIEYDLPDEICRHLEGENKHDPYACHQRLYSQRKNLEGLPECYVSGYKPYFQCKEMR